MNESTLDQFLAALSAKATAPGSQNQYLARTWLGFGGQRAFGHLELRSYYREGGSGTGKDILDRTFAPRSVLLSDTVKPYGSERNKAHLPELYRVQVRPREFSNARTLQIWHPGHTGDEAITVALHPDDQAQDILATPVDSGVVTNATSYNIAMPPLRISEGAVEGALEVKNDHFAEHMALDIDKSTIFGGIGIHLTGDNHWLVRLTAEGIEFDAALPDPTRGFAGVGAEDAQVFLRVRLETTPQGSPLDCPYLLRPIGPTKVLEAAQSADRIAEMISRLGKAVAGLVDPGNPARLRLNTGGRVPPVFWPLQFVKEVHTQLQFIPVPDTAAEPLVQFEPDALDFRLATRSNHPDADTGLARVFVSEAGWLKTQGAFEISLRAGYPLGSLNTAASSGGEVSLSYARDGDAWSGGLQDTIQAIPVHLPEKNIRNRLTPIYRAANAIPKSETAPYAFVAIRGGWLQLPLDMIASKNAEPTSDPREPVEKSQAMSGRIVFFPGVEADRGLSIDDAERMAVRIRWTGEDRPTLLHVELDGVAGQMLGFVFMADTSPTSREAVPVWTGGDATTREIPLWFGGDQSTVAHFFWSRGESEAWDLQFDETILYHGNPDLPWLAWLTPGPHPFVTNYPMTRSLPGARDPSPTRGLLPYEVHFAPGLSFDAGGATAKHEDELPELVNAQDTPLPGPPFSPAPQTAGAVPLVQSLLLPTLHGTEFPIPSDLAALGWSYSARLRYDLPALDELFAWSDPPPVEPADQLITISESASPATAGDVPPVVTALTPHKLSEIWRRNEHRMQLTWTQAALIADTAIPCDGVPKPISFDKIAAPFPFETEVAVTLSREHLFGEMSFPELTDQPDGLAGALVGLGGRVNADDKPLALTVSNGALEEDTGEAPQVLVTGYAADHYVDADTGLLTDNRGSGLANAPERHGLRRVAHRDKSDEAPDARFLLSPPQDMVVKTDQIVFGFAARDLPVVPLDDGTGGFRFQGISSGNAPSNSVEGRRDFSGQSLDHDALLDSIYEWRMYGEPESYDAPGTGTELLGRYEVRAGGFSFRPLRLIQVDFSDELAPKQLDVLGSLSIWNGLEDAGEAFAFGPDRVYDRDALFVLQARFDNGQWSTTLKPVTASNTDDGQIKLPDRENDAGLTLFRRFDVAPGSVFGFEEQIPALIRLDFDPRADWPEIKKGALSAQLFGSQITLPGTATLTDQALELDLKGPEASQAAELRLDTSTLKARVPLNAGGATLHIDGTMVCEAAPVEAQDSILLTYGATGLQWLDFGVPPSSDVTCTIDHTTGALILTLDDIALDDRRSALFGLPFPAVPVLSGTLAAVFAPQASHFATAHLHIQAVTDDGTTHAVRHVLTLQSGKADSHSIAMTWQTDEETCPIRWPVAGDGVKLNDGAGLQTLDQIAEGPLTPDPNSATAGEQNRLLTIEAGAEVLRHNVQVRLKSHQIPANRLRRGSGGIEPVGTLRMMAVVDHTLTSSVDPDRKVSWLSLDHLAITTAEAMMDEAHSHALAPRMSRRGGEAQHYRGTAVTHTHRPEGVAPLDDANAAGFHDPALAARLWASAESTGTLFLGHSALRLPLPTPGEDRAHVTLLPWAMGLPDDIALQAAEQSRTWRISTADAWAAHAITLTGNRTPIGANTALSQSAIHTLLGPAQAAVPNLIPLEHAFLESWDGGEPGDISDQAHVDAPYFLRALLALRARWLANQADGQWTAQTLIPRPWNYDGAMQSPILDTAQTLQPIEVTAALQGDIPPDPSEPLPADLIVLSNTQVKRVPAYRLIRPGQAGNAASDLRESALALVRDAIAVVRLVQRPDGHAVTLLARNLGQADNPLMQPGAGFVEPINDVGASPALGWPYPMTRSEPTGRFGLAPHIGRDHAIQTPEAGFSGRGQQIAWPALAPEGSAGVSAFYASFGQHVVFDRGASPFQFDGPAARHLSANPTRRRAPIPALTNAALTSSTDDPGATTILSVDETSMPDPLIPPLVDRLHIGRRPGAMEVSTTSLTLTQDRFERRHLLDRDWPGMGQPADVAPVVTAGLRTPRSTLLPPDPSPSKLNERRRTFLSRADILPDSEGDPTQDAELVPFATFEHPHDVIRLTSNTGTAWRITAAGDGRLQIGVTWQGRLSILLAGLKADPDETEGISANPKLPLGIDVDALGTSVTALLDVGGRVTQPKEISLSADEEQGPLGLDLIFPDVADIQSLLAGASADLPMSLTLQFPQASGATSTPTQLDVAPGVEMVLPVHLNPGMRRVVQTQSRTIAFGDPAYDRVLASLATSASQRVNGDEWRVACDRREFNADSVVHLAFGPIDVDTNLFRPSAVAPGKVYFQRFPFDQPGTAIDLSIRLSEDETLYDSAEIPVSTAVRLRLANLRDETTPQVRALQPGDSLGIRIVSEDFSQMVRVRIVAAPVIAPPASVYSVIDTLQDLQGGARGRMRLHAPASLPTRIEYPALLPDLARGHVRREALYIWHYAMASAGIAALGETHLIKLDRSGGAQLPELD